VPVFAVLLGVPDGAVEAVEVVAGEADCLYLSSAAGSVAACVVRLHRGYKSY
jgi:hypothetical protein